MTDHLGQSVLSDHLDPLVLLAIEQGAFPEPVRVGQTYARVAMLLRDGTRERKTASDHDRIRITGVPGGRAKLYRYVKLDPRPRGNGRRDHQEHRIKMVNLARHYALADDASER